MKDLLKSIIFGFGVVIGITVGMNFMSLIEDIEMKIRKAKAKDE